MSATFRFRASRPPTWALAGFLIGAALQVGALPLTGTGDVTTFKEWALSSVEGGVAQSYTRPVRPRPPDAPYFLRPISPPLSVALMFAVGKIASTVDPDLTVQSRFLTFMVKAPLLIVHLAVLAFVVSLAMRLEKDPSRAWKIGMALWLNPALILNGPTLGYLDPLCWGAGLAALVFAGTRRPAMAGAMLAAAVLAKHQGAFFVLPVLACLHTPRDMTRLAAAFAGIAGLLVAPFVVYGDPAQLGWALTTSLTQDLLSGDALNVWWAAAGIYKVVTHGWAALSVPLIYVEASVAAGVIGFAPGPFAAVAVVAASLMAFVRVRRHWCLPAAAALGALSVHTYFVFAINVHENHLIYSVPLAALVMLYWREYRKIFLALSAMVSINLLLFYGLGLDFSTPPHSGWFLPLTVLLSLGNVILLVMHWRAFLRRTASVSPRLMPTSVEP